jgi:hypothetical protein
MAGEYLGNLTADVEYLWNGMAQSGITISTCLGDRKLDESPMDLRPGKGNLERLRRPLDTIVEVLDDGLSPAEVQGLPGATIGT